MKKKFFLAILIIGVLVAAGIVFFQEIPYGEPETEQPAQQKPATRVKVVTVSSSKISKTLELTGSVEPYRVAKLASPAEGPVVGTRVREADFVKAGQSVLSIGRKKGVDALIASLREELRKEEDNLLRTQRLVESEALPGEQLDQARAAYEKVRAQLAQAEEKAQDYIITAPWAGVVSRVHVKDGEFVAPRAVLLEMYDPASLVVRAAVPEKYAAAVTVGMHVDVSLDAYPHEVIRGRVERVYPYLDSRLRTRTVEIALIEGPYLLPGMFARLNVVLEKLDDVVTVPVEALVTRSKGRMIFVVEDGKAVARTVETGIESGNLIQIVSGIRPGDKVIIAGNEKLKNGAEVRIGGGQESGIGNNKDIVGSKEGRNSKAGGGQK
jgi:membrane fusion protein, multidrug efflux system